MLPETCSKKVETVSVRGSVKCSHFFIDIYPNSGVSVASVFEFQNEQNIKQVKKKKKKKRVIFGKWERAMQQLQPIRKDAGWGR